MNTRILRICGISSGRSVVMLASCSLALIALRPELAVAATSNHAGEEAAHDEVDRWVKEAVSILKAHGTPAGKMNEQDIKIIIMHESDGNPNAQNNWDYNAQAGHPSIGLMQTIQSTFNAYKLPGHNNIRNPVDNIIATVRYAIATYGSVSRVPGVVAVHQGRAYVGY
jgi:Transglycosylase SLT domain